MNCQEFREHLEHCVEARGAVEAQAEEHACLCTSAPCQRAWLNYQLLELAIADWRADSPHVSLADRILSNCTENPAREDRLVAQDLRAGASVSTATPVPSRRKLSWTAAALAAAACLIAAVVIRSPGHSTGSLAHGPAGGNQVPAAEATELEEIGSMYVHWMEGASSRVTSTVAFVLLEEEPAENEPVPESSGWLKTWQEQLKLQIDDTFREIISEPSRDQSRSNLPLSGKTA